MDELTEAQIAEEHRPQDAAFQAATCCQGGTAICFKSAGILNLAWDRVPFLLVTCLESYPIHEARFSRLP